MKDGKKVVYWDSNIFLTVITKDKRDSELFLGAQETLTQLSKKDCFLVTSQITRIEVLQSKITENAEKIFDGVLKRSNVTVVDVGRRITDLSREIRDGKYHSGKVLSTPDSIHLATAIQYECDELHTNDGDDLLSLNGKINHPSAPKICRPPNPDQGNLLL